MSFTTYRVGRAPGSDVVFEDTRVSRRQVEVTVTAGQRHYVVDCNSNAGTFVLREGEWRPFVQGYVAPDETLAFGPVRVAMAELIKRLPAQTAGVTSPAEPVSVRPRRKVDTGEVELQPRGGAQ